MNIVIFEDELPAYKRLSNLLAEVAPEVRIAAHIDSVQAGREWLRSNPCPDALFLDIHLADGDAFDLLDSVPVPCPVVFVTAFDQYALKAFSTPAIDYLLKPVRKEDLSRALQKLSQHALSRHSTAGPAPAVAAFKKRFVIRYGEHIRTLPTEEIAYFFSEHKATFARTFDGRTFPVDYNLDALEPMLQPDDFFRINRQYIVQLKAIGDMKMFSKGRVIINLVPPVAELPVVSSEKAARFKLWLDGEL